MPSAGFVQVLADGSVTALWLGYGLVEVKERLQVDRATYEGKLFPKKEAEKNVYRYCTSLLLVLRARTKCAQRVLPTPRSHTHRPPWSARIGSWLGSRGFRTKCS